ncbi:hypothetical protein GAY30_27205 [Azospirillum brasilense]|uniref:hypothetical protein n=1 Tax=Azospirillum brasilense TaxID=192 RepID=UPI00157B8C86|nr:hypothetical protein [Azospirillum brasilense]NUB28516.1 hypothetical protein [Azospirillum brasilense]
MAQRLNFDEFFSRSADALSEDSELGMALARLPKVSADGPWLAGGALRRTLMRQSLDSDFDFFFASDVQFNKFCEAIKKAGGWQVSKNDHNTTFRLPSVAPEPTGEDEFSPYKPELTIQAITTQWYESPEAVVESFDFTLCQFAYDGTDLICGDYALWDLGRKRLVPHRLSFATSSLRRLLKYTKQGFTICGGGLANLLEQVLERPEIIHAETQYID